MRFARLPLTVKGEAAVPLPATVKPLGAASDTVPLLTLSVSVSFVFGPPARSVTLIVLPLENVKTLFSFTLTAVGTLTTGNGSIEMLPDVAGAGVEGSSASNW